MVQLFGCNEADLIGKVPEEIFDNKDADIINEVDQRNLNGENVNDVRSLTIAGKPYTFHTIQVPLRDSDSNIIGISGIVRDITDKKRAEEKIKASLKEKETLLNEIHHRVKNNLAVVSSLLKLQANIMKDEKLKELLMDSQSRVQSMSMIHETLYQSENLSSINMNTYLSNLGRDVSQNYTIGSRVNLKIEAENIMIGAKQASPLGLIVNELITNSYKYAFSEKKEGEIKISLQKMEDQIELVYTDNGIGIPKDFDWYNAKTMGLDLVKILAEGQLDGSIELNREQGTCFVIRFKQENTTAGAVS